MLLIPRYVEHFLSLCAWLTLAAISHVSMGKTYYRIYEGHMFYGRDEFLRGCQQLSLKLGEM